MHGGRRTVRGFGGNLAQRRNRTWYKKRPRGRAEPHASLTLCANPTFPHGDDVARRKNIRRRIPLYENQIGAHAGTNPSAIGKMKSLRGDGRSEEHTSELQSRLHLVCRLLLEKKQHIENERHRHTAVD